MTPEELARLLFGEPAVVKEIELAAEVLASPEWQAMLAAEGAEGWDEGYRRGKSDHGGYSPSQDFCDSTNPYRDEETR